MIVAVIVNLILTHVLGYIQEIRIAYAPLLQGLMTLCLEELSNLLFDRNFTAREGFITVKSTVLLVLLLLGLRFQVYRRGIKDYLLLT